MEVSLEPDQASPPYRHPGSVYGYIIEGAYEWAIKGQAAQTLKTCETFYEPTGCLHRISKNPGSVRTRVLAILSHPQDSKPISIPEPKN